MSERAPARSAERPTSRHTGVSWHTRDEKWQATLRKPQTEGQRRGTLVTRTCGSEREAIMLRNALVREFWPASLHASKLIDLDAPARSGTKRKRKRGASSSSASSSASLEREVIDLTSSSSSSAPPAARRRDPSQPQFAWQAKAKAKRKKGGASKRRRTAYTAAEDRAILRLYSEVVMKEEEKKKEMKGSSTRDVWTAVAERMQRLTRDFPLRTWSQYLDHFKHQLSSKAVAAKERRDAARDDVAYCLVLSLTPPTIAFSAEDDATLMRWVRTRSGSSSSSATLAPLAAWEAALCDSSEVRGLGRSARVLWRQYWSQHAAYVGETHAFVERLKHHNCEVTANSSCVTRDLLPLLRAVDPSVKWQPALTVRGFPPRCGEGAEARKKVPRKKFEFFWLYQKVERHGLGWRLRTFAQGSHRAVQGKMSTRVYEFGRALEELHKTLQRFAGDPRHSWGSELNVQWFVGAERTPPGVREALARWSATATAPARKAAAAAAASSSSPK